MSGAAGSLGAIRVSGMRFWGKHGAQAGERERAQPIDVDVEIVADLRKAAASDAIADTIDYTLIHQTCERIVTQQSFSLLEALADRIAEAVCADSRVAEITVRVRKPRLLDGATPEIELRKCGGTTLRRAKNRRE